MPTQQFFSYIMGRRS